MQKDLRKNLRKGHRARMRAKFVANGARIFETYELLEMLLYYVVPYKDTKDTAKLLLKRFGSIDGVLSASREELSTVEGVGGAVADLILSVGRVTDKERVGKAELSHIYDNYADAGKMVVDYFRANSITGPAVALFLFDNYMHLIDAKILYELDYESGGVHADAFLNFAVNNRASIAISAHVHKYGACFPTVGDIETNKVVTAALGSVNIRHAEHYIVAGERFVGIMEDLERAYVKSPELMRFYESKKEGRYEGR